MMTYDVAALLRDTIQILSAKGFTDVKNVWLTNRQGTDDWFLDVEFRDGHFATVESAPADASVS